MLGVSQRFASRSKQRKELRPKTKQAKFAEAAGALAVDASLTADSGIGSLSSVGRDGFGKDIAVADTACVVSGKLLACAGASNVFSKEKMATGSSKLLLTTACSPST